MDSPVPKPCCLQDLHAGSTQPGDCGNDPETIPPWMDMVKFKRGQKFFQDHVMAILLALYCSLTTGLSISNLLDPLVYTKKSDTPSKALSRYVYTFLHVSLWHLENVWDPKERAHKSTQMVRRMHSHVAKQMNQGGGERLYISQYDMALVQCGFMGSVVLYPTLLGIRCSKQDIEDYIFFWRGIGYLLGIADQYNMCSGDYEQTYGICREIERKLLIPNLVNPPVDFAKMADAYVEGTNMRRRVLRFTKESVVAFSQMQMGVPHQRLSLGDWIRVFWLRSVTFLIKWCPFFERVNNALILRNVRAFVPAIFRDQELDILSSMKFGVIHGSSKSVFK